MAVLRDCCPWPTCRKRRKKRHGMKVAALAQCVPQCWQAWPQHPGSSVWPHPTTGLSLLPHPSPGTSSEGLAAPRQAGIWCSPKGSLWLSLASSTKCCLLREGATLLGAGHPRALCSFNPPRTRMTPAVSWWSLGISKPWQQIPGPAPSTGVLWLQVLSGEIHYFL